MSTTTLAAYNIIARLDPATHRPVVFNTDNMTNSTIECWDGKDAIEQVSMAYYHTCKPLSAQDMEQMRKRFARYTGAEAFLRYRLPRTVREVPSILSKPGRPAAAPAPAVDSSVATPKRGPGRPPRVTAPATPQQEIDLSAALAGLQAKFNLELEALMRTASAQKK